MLASKSILILFVLTLVKYNLALEASSDEIIGCGGFIKSNTEINFNTIKIKLLTKERGLKYTTEASSINGYYMIPVYNKGEYILKVEPPLGWSFEPNEIQLIINGINDPCSKNEDINFNFRGFGLSGKVVSYGDANKRGPSGVTLNLLTPNGVNINTTLSGSDGSYYFTNVMPGDYQIEASHDSFKFKNNKVVVSLSKENWSPKDDIIVTGYDIEGFVMTSDLKPVEKAQVYLSFQTETHEIDTSTFDCVKPLTKHSKFLCSISTDSNGYFKFGNIAYGRYYVTSELTLNNRIQLKTSPEQLQVDLVKHKNINLKENPFITDLITIKSKAKISISDKSGFNDASIILNGKTIESKTVNDGDFVLDSLKKGEYSITLVKDGTYFETKTINIDFTRKFIESLNEISKNFEYFYASEFDICGKVTLTDTFLSTVANDNDFVKLKLNNQIVSTSKSKNFEYCFKKVKKLEDTQYQIEIQIDGPFKDHIRFADTTKSFKLSREPLKNIDFKQIDASLNGNIQFKCSNDLKIKLKSLTLDTEYETSVTCATPNEGTFKFDHILFDTYSIETNMDKFYCFIKKDAKDGKEIQVKITNKKQSIDLINTGFKLTLNFDTYENTKLLLKSQNFDQSLEISTSTTTICLPLDVDKYQLSFDSCNLYKLDDISSNLALKQVEDNKYEMDVSNLSNKNEYSLKFNLVKNKLVILVKKYDSLGKNKNDKNFKLQVTINGNSGDSQIVTDFEQNGDSFESQLWLDTNKPYRFDINSNKYLFEPEFIEYQLKKGQCNRIEFAAKFGFFFKGKINPSNIDGIKLVIKSGETNDIFHESLINSNDGFELGPFKEPRSQYKIEVTKDGYLFKQLKEELTQEGFYLLELIGEKYGELNVKITDKLENVLVSLSSANRQLRKTIKTNADGLAKFDSLEPDLYYLIVMMQEYKFEPNTHTIRIEDGSRLTFEIKSTRIAYSVFGRVTSLNGSPQGNVLIEAKSIKNTEQHEDDSCIGIRESALSDNQTGIYRIRDLKPNCNYEIRHKTQEDQLEYARIEPESMLRRVEQADTYDCNFIIFDKFDFSDVTLHTSLISSNQHSLTIHPQFKNQIRIKLLKTNQPEFILQTLIIEANSIVNFNRLPKSTQQQYTITIELLALQLSLQSTTTQTNQIAIDRTELTFYADSTHKQLALNFDIDNKYESKLADTLIYQAQYQNTFFALPLLLIITTIIYFKFNEITELLSKLKLKLEQNGLIFTKLLNKPTSTTSTTSIVSTKSNKNRR